MKAAILTIGDEILIGQITDTNSGWIARQMNDIGAEVVRMISVGDDMDDIHRGFDQAFELADIVLVTGGLGPTKDDITKKALAEYFDDELIFHQPSYDLIERMFNKRGIPIRESHRVQCYLPSSATLIENNMGTAQGIWMEHGGKALLSMPGIPYEMKAIMKHGGGLSKISTTFSSKAIAHRTILTAGEGETTIATLIESVESNLPKHIKLAFLPSLGRVRLRLSGIGDDQFALERQLEVEVDKIKALIPDLIFGYGVDTLESVLGNLLIAKGLTIGTCESCSGGFLSYRITSVPGSSAYYQGSIVSYSYSLKKKLLNVSAQILEQEGAVSEATVIEMVTGGLVQLKTDIVVSISGIAGPSGGTPDKPVGTIWLAIGNSVTTKSSKLLLGKNREKNIEYTAYFALNMIRKFVLEHYNSNP